MPGSESSQAKVGREFLKTFDPKDFYNNGGWKSGAADYLHRRYPDLWPTKESARNTLRYLTLNKVNNKNTKHKAEFFKIEIDLKEDFSWQTPLILPSGISEIAIFGDTHGDYMNQYAINEACEVASGVKTLVINGDLLDNTQLSRWAKQKDSPILSSEFYHVKQLLEQLRKRFDNIYFKKGNHDQWLARKLSEKGDQYPTEVSDKIQEKVTLEEFLKFSEYGIKVIHDLQEIRFGDLSILHGHEKSGAGSPLNLAQGILTWWQRYEKRWDVKILVNHHHWVDEIKKVNYEDKTGYAWANGCLCDTRPKYHPYGRHLTGCAIATQSNGIADVKLFRV